MITLTDHGVFLDRSAQIITQKEGEILSQTEGRTRTMAYQILAAHNKSGVMEQLRLCFDALVSPDNNYVNILQTARASGIEKFPVPYVLSNCHNTLCAVGGTINEDDHKFGLDNVKKYGGIFVPPYRAVLHQYMRERMAGCGKMILGSDSHTRYGALGTMGIGEGGGEIAKQLLGRTYDIAYPPVIAVRLHGTPRPGVGPMDVALSLIGATFANGFNKNKVLEFVGRGIAELSMEYRMGIDVMTTESAALSSIWMTDEKTREYLRERGREEEYAPLAPEEGAYYDGLIDIDLSAVECMIALPYHPSRAMPIRAFLENLEEELQKVEEEGRKIKGDKGKPFSIMSHVRDGGFYPDQALVSGCCGGMFENICAVADILKDCAVSGGGLGLGVNPASMPIMEDLMRQGIAGELAVAGVVIRPSMCGPCFGVTDVPGNDQLSIRHVTRNYSTREGAKPGQGQMAAVCLMDARSIAATVRNGGRLTAASDLDIEYRGLHHRYNPKIYENQVFDCYGKAEPEHTLTMGPNIADWPAMQSLKKHLLMKVAGSYAGPVTTDELIPSGEPSSFRSNPEKLSGYTMISRDPAYVGIAKEIRAEEAERAARPEAASSEVTYGSIMAADQIGDGSSREQAASCQKVLGGFANLSNEYATKRYRSNLINWGLLPIRTEEKIDLPMGSYVFVRDVWSVLEKAPEPFEAEVYDSDAFAAGIPDSEKFAVEPVRRIRCTLDALTPEEKKILKAGCLINYYRGN